MINVKDVEIRKNVPHPGHSSTFRGGGVAQATSQRVMIGVPSTEKRSSTMDVPITAQLLAFFTLGQTMAAHIAKLSTRQLHTLSIVLVAVIFFRG
ncbi:MAG: hypothetical protein HZC22_07210 [Rhodocyclales bacterium]|nr:hypothetical protein [Rhodocyclales bacterium]